MANQNDQKVAFGLVGILALVLAVVVALFASVYTIDAGERGIVLSWGSVSSVEDDGLHFKVPFVQTVKLVDVRTRKAEAPAQAASSDMQRVASEVSLNYRLDADKLATIYTKTGVDIEASLIDPRIQEVVKGGRCSLSG